MVHPSSRVRRAGRGGEKWYLSDLELDGDVEVVSSTDLGKPSVTGEAAAESTRFATGNNGNDKSSPSKRKIRPHWSEDSMFVPVDRESLLYDSRPQPSSRTHVTQLRMSETFFVVVVAALMFLSYCTWSRIWQRGLPARSEQSSREKGSKELSERKKSKKKRQKERKRASKLQQLQLQKRQQQKHQRLRQEEEGDRAKILSHEQSTIIVKQEEHIAFKTEQLVKIEKEDINTAGTLVSGDRTPPASPSRQELQLTSIATPQTPMEYKMHVKAIASVVSSTGLDEQQALQIANEAVIRRLDYEVSQKDLMHKELRREHIEEARRDEDKKEANRRHDESLKAMKGEKDISTKLGEARKRCFSIAFQIFPGGQFLVGLSLALLSMFATLNFAPAIRGLYSHEQNRTFMYALRHVCGCTDGSGDDSSADQQYSYTLMSVLSYAVEYCPSSMNTYLFAPISGWLVSTTCFALCLLKGVGFLTALGLTHRLLRLFHSNEFVHQAANALSLSTALLSSLVKQSSYHDTNKSLILDIIVPVATANTYIMALLLGLLHCFKEDGELRADEHNDDQSLQKKLVLYNSLAASSRVISSFSAIAIGFYWGLV